MNNEELFVKELTELSKKYGVYISGCGCCGSPFLTDKAPDYPDGDLYWNNETKEYEYKGGE